METIIIGSFNLRNHYWDPFWNGKNYPQKLAEFIKENNINFLGTQEMREKYSKNLQTELGDTYTITEKYRYGNIPFIDQFNESNAIITDQPIIYSETKHLAKIPFYNTQMPRIMTLIETKEQTIINTHIEYQKTSYQIYQLKVLYNYIKQILINNENPPIITGDFNMEPFTEHFKDFIEALKQLGISQINNNTPTYITKEQILDYIFIPNNYEITDVEVIQNQSINQISDHRPIIVKARKKN